MSAFKVDELERNFQAKVGAEVRLAPEGMNRFRVFTPFLLDDGDHLGIVMKRTNGDWSLSDEGSTFLHLSYTIDSRDLEEGTRHRIIERTLHYFGIEDRFGELRLPIVEENYGDALYTFVQALLRINDVNYLSREQVRSTFLEDFKSLISNAAPADRLAFEWHHEKLDPDARYAVDCKINGLKNPILVYALSTDTKTRDATISLLKFEQWGFENQSVGIFENQEGISRSVLARFSDVCGKQFSSLKSNEQQIERWVKEALGEAA